ncbi:MAG: hypothetical protein AB7E45_07955, partial [Candidatus Caldatribacteriota bacterium]
NQELNRNRIAIKNTVKKAAIFFLLKIKSKDSNKMVIIIIPGGNSHDINILRNKTVEFSITHQQDSQGESFPLTTPEITSD